MKGTRRVLYLLIVLFIPLFAQQGSMNWIQATANAQWSSRSRHTSVVFDNKIWVIGGADSIGRKNDVWFSSNGVNWTRATANAGWSARYDHASVVFNNMIWVIGGYDGSPYKNDVWYSSDGINWARATANAGWSARYEHTSVVFDNKIWVIGGADSIGRKNDVWFSSDGVNWTRATANAGWLARYDHASVVFDNKMWVIGGNNSGGPNDVWYSTNGTYWMQATSNAGWPYRDCHTSVAYDNKIWVIGGAYFNDVWYSSNGINWTRATVFAGWTGRSNHTSVVYDNKIWVMGGSLNYSPYRKNDVWYSMGSIVLLIPNGGEFWQGSSNQIIKWRTIGTNFTRYRLLLSRDGGASYSDTISHNISSSDTSYQWLVPNLNLNVCRVVIQMLDTNYLIICQDSSDSNFTIDSDSPSVPILVYPDSNYISNISIVTFVWQHSTDNLSGVRSYTLQYCTNSSFVAPVTIDSITDTTRVVNEMTDSIFYWRVRSIDRANNTSGWSQVRRFRINAQPPVTPLQILPINGLITNSSNITFIWRRSLSLDVQFYTLQYARNVSFIAPDSIRRTDTTFNINLTDSTYYWRVRAIDSAGNVGSWSSVWNFEIDTRVPNTPVLTSPLNGIWITNTSVIFNWSSVTFNAKSPVRYIIQVDTTTNFTIPIIDTTSYVRDTLVLNQGRYYWRVRAYDLAGNQGAFSSRDSFGVDNTTPSIPLLVSPVNSAILTDSFVRFFWHRSTDNLSGIRNYQINIANNSNFINAFDTTLADTTILRKLRDTTYYWKAKAFDIANNQSNWSSVWNFRVRTTGIKEITNLSTPTIFSLSLNLPNPFSRFTEIGYSIPITTKVKISVFNSFGSEIMTLVNNKLNQGWYSVRWDGRDSKGKNLSSGIYFCRLVTDEFQATRKLLLQR